MKTERPDLAAVKRRLALRSSNAAVPIPSGRRYKRKAKHPRATQMEQRSVTSLR